MPKIHVARLADEANELPRGDFECLLQMILDDAQTRGLVVSINRNACLPGGYRVSVNEAQSSPAPVRQRSDVAKTLWGGDDDEI